MPSAELGRAFAKLLGESESHQLGVCGKLGIPWKTHCRWMAADAEPESELAVYQSLVVEALDKQRRADLKKIETEVRKAKGTHAATVWNMRKHRHESRFKRFYDDAQKIELAGEGGGAIRSESKVTHGLTREASRELKLKFLGIRPEFLRKPPANDQGEEHEGGESE